MWARKYGRWRGGGKITQALYSVARMASKASYLVR
jgi:hypothetical protein